MRDLLNFFDKPKDPLAFDAVQVSLASSDKIRSWSHGEVKNPRQSIIAHLNLNEMDCFAPKFLALLKITSAYVENISA